MVEFKKDFEKAKDKASDLGQEAKDRAERAYDDVKE